MARLYADHNFSRPTTRLLRDRGHDVVTTRELGLDRASDGAQLLVATAQGRIVLTYNERDFVLLHDAWLRWTAAWQIEPRHPGIIVLPQDQRWDAVRSVREIESVLREAADPATRPRLANQLWLWRPARGWIEFAGFAGSGSGRPA